MVLLKRVIKFKAYIYIHTYVYMCVCVYICIYAFYFIGTQTDLAIRTSVLGTTFASNSVNKRIKM